MKIAIIGTRGIPANYGGFETFAEEIATRMVERGVETFVVGDKGQEFDESVYKGVQIKKVNISKPSNPLLFYYKSLKIAVKEKADFVLMCGVGGSMIVPFVRKGLTKVAINPDGLGFKRDKYVWWKKKIFFSQYWMAARMAPYLVYDSKGIQDYFHKYLNRSSRGIVIEYGSYINPFLEKKYSQEDYNELSLPFTPNKYHLVVARLEPENNVEMIIKGYLERERKYPLVVVGNVTTSFAKKLIEYKTDKLFFFGGVYEKKRLQLLRAGSLSYFHGHSVGGTNPSLLEAMGSANLCVCHDNIFNRETIGANGLYFRNVEESSKAFDKIESGDINRDEMTQNVLNRVKTYYNWALITGRYLNLAEKLNQ